MYLIHEENSERNFGLRLLWVIPAALFIGALLFLHDHKLDGFRVLLLDAVLVSAIFYFVFPRKFQIYTDKLRIVLGRPFAINIALSSIKEVRHSEGYKAYVYSGIRFATSTRYVIEILRIRGINYIISPQNGELFLQQLSQALKSRDV